MLVDLTCPGCGAKFRLNREVTGPQWTCGGCGARIDVTQDNPSAGVPSLIDDSAPPHSVDIIAWERFRVAAQIAAWGGMLGFIGTLLQGALSFAPSGRPGPLFSAGLPLYLSASTAAVIALLLEFAFVIVAAGVCRSSNVAAEARNWGTLSLISMTIPLVMMLAFSFLLYGIGRDGMSLNMIINVIFLAGYFGYLAGHACLAAAFVGSADPNGRTGLRTSLIQYLCLLAALAIWFLFILFVFQEEGGVGGGLLYGGGPQAGFDEGWIQLLIYTAASAVQLGWYRHISRRAGELARRRQISMA